ncbi:MAG: CAP domain-containing protein [Candidatus Pacebacteria bacterium]|nr:CAP domain-containing protein [Candidatus Paceibacterota bacterium]MDD5357000.1 CAP domain-containing protein [Candidatus Paceibacterota bacterium]
MWKFIKFLLSIVLLILILAYFLRIPLSWARLNKAVDNVRALVPEKVLSFLGQTENKKTENPSASKSASPLSIIPALQNLSEKIFAPSPLRVASSKETGNLTRSGVISLTNAERAKVSLSLLKENALLDADAQKKMQDMFAKQYFEHVSPSGVGPGDLAKSVGYDYIIVGENLALGNFKDDATLIAAWMASPGHKENILQPKYKEIGVAVGKGLYEGQETWIAVQSFGLPSSACPEPSITLKAEIKSLDAQIASLEKMLKAKKAEIDAASDDSTYNKKVVEYNALVTKYDALIDTRQADAATYNEGVRTSNACRQKAAI